jgi:hypothetical protein
MQALANCTVHKMHPVVEVFIARRIHVAVVVVASLV